METFAKIRNNQNTSCLNRFKVSTKNFCSKKTIFKDMKRKKIENKTKLSKLHNPVTELLQRFKF